MIPSQLQPLANHLWQSTAFAAIAGLVTLALRKNRAQTRYWLWLVASVKFLIPFSLLVDVGSHWGPTPAAPSGLSYVIEQASQPFTAPTPPASTSAAAETLSLYWLPAVLCSIWAIGSAALVSSWWRRWRRICTELQTASPVDLQIGMKAMTSPAFAEPGIFGVRRPVLLLPAGIADCLTPSQFKAIVAHELCHVSRRDNLATAIHMGIEALFWFHPMVWWLGARLMQERERACDEDVLLMGTEPQVYAEGILKICELYLESPLACVSGVSGANLRKRIEEIMANRIGTRLDLAQKIALAGAGAAALAGPVVVGVMNVPEARAQSAQSASKSGARANAQFEVASVKRSQERTIYMGVRQFSHGRVLTENTPLKFLIGVAYKRREGWFEISGAPGWMDSDGYDIVAKASADNTNEQMYPMLQALLRDRFQLKLHRETMDLPVYNLVAAKGGLKLQNPKPQDCVAGSPGAEPPPTRGSPLLLPCGNVAVSLAPLGLQIRGGQTSMQRLATILSGVLGRTVVDKTDFHGTFDIDLEFTPDDAVAGIPGRGMPGALPTDPPSGDHAGPSIFAALQERLGLKLESAKGPVTVLVVDHVERPSEN
jgi:bla regulator protein blaR1